MKEEEHRKSIVAFFIRGMRFVIGFVIFILFRRRVDLGEIVNGKRVAIIGAADSLQGSKSGAFIDGFDVVVRVNKAALLIKEGRWRDDMGTKVDLLFHSFYENEKSGGGVLDLQLFDRLGVQYLINPIADWGGNRVIFNFYKKYLEMRRVYILQKSSYERITSRLEGFKPTIGFCALHSIMEQNFAELYITGFTFFRTPFADGYRNDIRESKKAIEYIRSAGLHNPDLEFEAFLKLLGENAKKKVVLDRTLLAIVEAKN